MGMIRDQATISGATLAGGTPATMWLPIEPNTGTVTNKIAATELATYVVGTIASATTSVAGFMSAADKTKLNLITITGAASIDTLVSQSHAAVTATNASIALSGQAVSVAIDGGANNLLSLAGGGLRVDVPAAHVTYAKIQNVSATDKLLGRSTAGAGSIEEITCTAFARTILDDADATATRTTLGLGTLATQSGTFSGTSSGTNTGDQTITLSGAVTGSGTGAITTTLTAHNHAASEITSGTIATARLGSGTANTTAWLRGDQTWSAVAIADGTYGQIVVGSSGTSWSLSSTAAINIKSVREGTFAITDGASVDIDPANGGIQTWTLGANRTPTATNFASGQAVTLMITAGASFSVTWTTIGVVWVGGSAPILPTTGKGVVELWKVSTTVYGAYVGDVA